MTNQIDRPKCLYCGKPLRKFTSKVFDHEIGTPDPVEHSFQGRIVQVTKRDPLHSSRAKAVEVLSVWCGRWGDYGDNRFCGKTCGWRWALKYTQRPPDWTSKTEGTVTHEV